MHEADKTANTLTGTNGLEPLFTAVLQYRSNSQSDAAVSTEGREGALIGSGDGRATGEQVEGTVLWSLWSGNCVYPSLRRGQPIPDGLHLCTMNPGGLIQTPDGAQIRFDGKGYGLRTPKKYHVSLILSFGTEDTRYAWLRKVLGMVEGDFDEKAGRATWRVYVPTGSHRSGS